MKQRRSYVFLSDYVKYLSYSIVLFVRKFDYLSQHCVQTDVNTLKCTHNNFDNNTIQIKPKWLEFNSARIKMSFTNLNSNKTLKLHLTISANFHYIISHTLSLTD